MGCDPAASDAAEGHAAARHVVYADTSGRSEGDLFAPISKRPKLADGDWAAYGKRLTALAERMADFGVGMAFHHHMGTIVETDAEVDRLMAATGQAVGLLFDCGHSIFSGGDPIALLKRHVGRVVHVHCKDARPRYPQARARVRRKLHAGGARRRLHHAGRRLRRFPGDLLDPAATPAIPAGSWRRPSRIRPRRIRSPMRAWASATSPASP